MNDPLEHPAVAELISRSNELGSDPRNTNYGGGNTSAKGQVLDPTAGSEVELLWVKGSGGDLGTLTPEGLSLLVVERLRRLKDLYEGEHHEDEMHDMLSYCAFGEGGRDPSIDTAMHGLVPAPHVDHLHPDSIIALAAAADGEKLTAEIFGDEVAWVPWRRPGFDLGVQMEEIYRADPSAKGVVLGGHGLTTWGQTSEQCRDNSLELIRRAAEHIDAHGGAEPLGPVRAGFEPLPREERWRRAVALAPVIRGLASTDARVVGHWNDDEVVLDFIARQETPRVVPLGTSCPDHFIRTKVRPLLLDLPATAAVEDQIARLRELHQQYREDYRAYYQRYADEESPAMRGADPAIVLVPGVGMFSFGSDSPTARIAGEFYVNAINVIKGAEALSTYDPVPESEKFRVEYWVLEERKLQRRPPPRPLTGRIALVTGAASGIGRAIAHRLREEGAVVVLADVDADGAQTVAEELGARDHALPIGVDVRDEATVRAAVEAAICRFGGLDVVVNNAGLSLSKPLVDTELSDWDTQYDVMARGSFLVAKHAVEVMLAQDLDGDLIYIVSKNAVAAGPNNVAYGSAKASQAHQVRLLAAELGDRGIRVNGINPDGVVRGSRIFEGEWGQARAEIYGVEREELGAYYASRTLLKREVLPAHVADAVFCLLGGELTRTTGLIIPVDSGLPAAFPR